MITVNGLLSPTLLLVPGMHHHPLRNDGATTAVGGQQLLTSGSNASAAKKNTSRRNAWGNLSYADLITQAISSASETRLTLSQIYEWMVQNVPYFKDKGDSNSSAGWKVSVDITWKWD